MDRTIQTPPAPLAPRRGFGLRRWIFAALFVVLLVMGFVQILALAADDAPRPILQMQGGQLVASGALSRDLHTREAVVGRPGPTVGPIVRDADGRECRRFAGRPAVEGPIAGTACLVEGKWRVVELKQDVAPPRLR